MGLHILHGVTYGGGPSKASQLPIVDTEGILGTAGATTNTQLLADALADGKQDKGVTLTASLAVGSTTVTFTDSAISSTALIDIYTNIYGVNPTDVTVSGTTATLTFKPQGSAVSVKIIIH